MRRNDFVEIMEVIDKRLNDKGKNWRHVFKVSDRHVSEPGIRMRSSRLVPLRAHPYLQALVVLDYLLHPGSENVIRYCEENLYEIKTLREFQYTDDASNDCGMNVRQKAKDITNLVLNPNVLKSKRRKGSAPPAAQNVDESAPL